jgi:hypothetical protein
MSSAVKSPSDLSARQQQRSLDNHDRHYFNILTSSARYRMCDTHSTLLRRLNGAFQSTNLLTGQSAKRRAGVLPTFALLDGNAGVRRARRLFQRLHRSRTV